MPISGNADQENKAVEAPARRYRSKQERLQIVEESFQPGTSVAVVARRHGVNANQIFQWRKMLRDGRLDTQPAPTQLMPVRITDSSEDRIGSATPHTGVIQIELGRVRVRVEGSVDPATLRIILEQLR